MHSSPFKSLVLACAIATLTACGGAENTSQQTSDSTNPAPENPQLATKDVSFRLDVSKALNAGVSATRAEVRVFNDLLERSSSADIADQAASISFTALPLGSYSIEVKVFDGTTLIATGTGSAQVNANDTTAVNLLVNPVTGNLDVAICMPDIATQYFTGAGDTAITELGNANQHDAEQPAYLAYQAAMAGVTDFSFEYRVGDTNLVIPEEGSLSPVFVTDHGASLTINVEGQQRLNISGCNTQIAAYRSGNTLTLWYSMAEAYSGIHDITVGSISAGTVESQALALVMVFSDNNGDAFPSGTTSLSEVNFANFEQTKFILGVPVVTNVTGTATVLFTDPDSVLEHYWLAR